MSNCSNFPATTPGAFRLCRNDFHDYQNSAPGVILFVFIGGPVRLRAETTGALPSNTLNYFKRKSLQETVWPDFQNEETLVEEFVLIKMLRNFLFRPFVLVLRQHRTLSVSCHIVL